MPCAAPYVMSALRRRVEEPVEDAGMAPMEERAPKIWKTATVAVLLFVTGSVRRGLGPAAPCNDPPSLTRASAPPHPPGCNTRLRS